MEMELFMEENRQLEREFLGQYNLDANLFERMGFKVKQIIPVRSVYRIVTDKGFFCLKKLRFSIEEMNFIFGAIDHLKANGFQNVFNIVKQKDGSNFLDFNGEKYFLTEWIDGRECDFLNPMDLDTATEVLAKLHNATKGYLPPVCPSSRDYLGKWPENFQRRIGEMEGIKQQVLQKQEKSQVDSIYMDYVDMCINDAKEALGLLEGACYRELVEQATGEQGFIHHDYAHHNILHSFDGRTYVLDFDYCIRDIRIHDLGSLIIRNMKRCNWDIDKAMTIIEGYDRWNSISKNELKVLVPFLLFPQDFWIVSRQYYIEKKDWEEEEYVDKMNTKSSYTAERRKFIEEFGVRCSS